MTDAPINHGTLTDKEGAGFPGCRIQVEGEQQDRPFVVMSHVQRYLDNIPKKARVCFTTKDGKISKVWEDKEKSAPAQQTAPAQGNTETCTSPKDPALKTVEGQIVFIDHGAHKIAVKDRAGVSHTFVWPPQFNDAMAKLKPYWFTRIAGEVEPEFPDLWRLTAQDFFKRPDDWPQSQHHGGSRGNFTPRNEKPMLYESVFKSLCEMFDPDKDGKGKSFEENARRIWAMTKEIGDEMAEKVGVQ